jgi:putative transposase
LIWLCCSHAPTSRIHLDGVHLHIVQRGHNRQPCFFAAADYLAYLEWLGEAALRTGCQLRAYALMTNHVHLLFTPCNVQAVFAMMMAMADAMCLTSTPPTSVLGRCGRVVKNLR